MKKIFLSLVLLILTAPAKAAVTFAISSTTFVTDTTQGTFTVNSQTVGALVGVVYNVTATDGVTLVTCGHTLDFPIVPRTTLPAAAVLRTAIQNDLAGRTFPINAEMTACVAAKNNNSTRSRLSVNPNIPGVDGTAVTPP